MVCLPIAPSTGHANAACLDPACSLPSLETGHLGLAMVPCLQSCALLDSTSTKCILMGQGPPFPATQREWRGACYTPQRHKPCPAAISINPAVRQRSTSTTRISISTGLLLCGLVSEFGPSWRDWRDGDMERLHSCTQAVLWHLTERGVMMLCCKPRRCCWGRPPVRHRSMPVVCRCQGVWVPHQPLTSLQRGVLVPTHATVRRP